ncbi:Pre-rRNA-processing protein TSR2 [Intoshia linei]|uniref:Pre-rRNA-processing protein TSR2 homolog n=1 Tax=Intoshia linei TaxID=1819745 RepID=A0A177BC82_9BILA|nr:Pre-rRNA-processing protein TSR2 [Intoshia linei]
MDFSIIVTKIFSSWSTLQFLKKNSEHPHVNEICEWLISVVVDWFKMNDDIQNYELSSFIQEILDNELNVYIDDGSLNLISSTLCECYRNLSNQKLEPITVLLEKLDITKTSYTITPFETTKINSTKPEKQIDEDGWILNS